MNKKGTWGRAKCKRTYIESDEEYAYVDIAKMSGYAESTINRWSANDERGTWHEQRERFRRKLNEQLEQKTIEKYSEKFSDEFSDVAKRHYSSYRIFTELAVQYGRTKLEILRRAEASDPVQRDALLNMINPTEVNFWNLVLDRSLKGEAASLGLPYYVNSNSAIAETEKLGYIPVALPPGMKKSDLQEMIDGFEPDS